MESSAGLYSAECLTTETLFHRVSRKNSGIQELIDSYFLLPWMSHAPHKQGTDVLTIRETNSCMHETGKKIEVCQKKA